MGAMEVGTCLVDLMFGSYRHSLPLILGSKKKSIGAVRSWSGQYVAGAVGYAESAQWGVPAVEGMEGSEREALRASEMLDNLE